ncbi:peptidoglycan editing factor PgeF [Hippea alviniae]|uniref:peptidoglycan editing factor PgeF n=1 Tax=Hippea alviniae TaxID=1279027 RepID=UPI0003B78DC9|nr:peptidoglycan editing factor PgeF [Hippea alviniae]
MGFIEDLRFREFGARCVYFDRFGGVSPPPFDSLNVSTTVGDKRENVWKNLEIVRETVKADEIALLNQVHSNTIVEYDDKIHDADGIFTDRTGVFLAIKFADCTPIMFLDRKNGFIGAAHAGWRGTHLKISVKMVEFFIEKGSKPEDIIVSIGPHICGNCYEIKDDVAEKFDGRFIKKSNGRLYLNLSEANINQLINSGIPKGNIKNLSMCTFEDKRFFSYRRDKTCGRNIGGVMLIS